MPSDHFLIKSRLAALNLVSRAPCFEGKVCPMQTDLHRFFNTAPNTACQKNLPQKPYTHCNVIGIQAYGLNGPNGVQLLLYVTAATEKCNIAMFFFWNQNFDSQITLCSKCRPATLRHHWQCTATQGATHAWGTIWWCPGGSGKAQSADLKHSQGSWIHRCKSEQPN